MSYIIATGSKQFRDQVLSEYPNLDKNPAYWHLFMYLLSPGMLDRDDKTPVIPQHMLSSFLGTREKDGGTKEFLDGFKRDVLPDFEYSEHSINHGRARTVTNDGLGNNAERFQKALRIDVLANKDREIILSTGQRASSENLAPVKRQLERPFLIANPLGHRTPLSDKVISYHNLQDERSFSYVINKNIADTYDFLDDVLANPSNPETIKRKALYALKALPNIKANPKPLYRTSANTARPNFPRNSPGGIWGPARRKLTANWVHYDLNAAQLAILAYLFKLPSLKHVLQSPDGVWPYLANTLSVSLEEYKPAFKKAIYTLAFGGSKKTIKDNFLLEVDHTSSNERLFDSLMGIDIVADLFAVRQNYFDNPYDFGKTITPMGALYDPKTPNQLPRQTLAHTTQLIEFYLLRPLYNLVDTSRTLATTPFDVKLYIYDGFAVRYEDVKRQATYEGRIIDAIEQEAHRLGIYTYVKKD